MDERKGARKDHLSRTGCREHTASRLCWPVPGHAMRTASGDGREHMDTRPPGTAPEAASMAGRLLFLQSL